MTKYLIMALVAGIAIFAGGYAIYTMMHKDKGSAAKSIAFGEGLSYVAIGDSYTIGEGEAETNRWPNQLVAGLKVEGTKMFLAANLSRTGYTTQDIQTREIDMLKKANPDFVTLLVGVNDYIQGASADEFTNRYRKTLDDIQAAAPKAKILLITIPDFSKTPAGATIGNPVASESGIRTYNKIIITEATQRKLAVADIFAISQKSSSAGELVSDGLHPSGAQYTKWLSVIQPKAKQVN